MNFATKRYVWRFRTRPQAEISQANELPGAEIRRVRTYTGRWIDGAMWEVWCDGSVPDYAWQDARTAASIQSRAVQYPVLMLPPCPDAKPICHPTDLRNAGRKRP